jgi:putative flippase GtrA
LALNTIAADTQGSVIVAAPDEAIRSAVGTSVFFTLRAHAARLLRYSATSLAALAVSESALLVLYGTGILNATAAALVGNLAGTVPSYLLSRYWIWREAPRDRTVRQILLYWSTSIVCIALSSVATGEIARTAPKGLYPHLLVAGSGFFAMSFILWVAKYLVYHYVIFPVIAADADATRQEAAS